MGPYAATVYKDASHKLSCPLGSKSEVAKVLNKDVPNSDSPRHE